MKRIKSRNTRLLQPGDEIVITELGRIGRDEDSYKDKFIHEGWLGTQKFTVIYSGALVQVKKAGSPEFESMHLLDRFTYIKEVQQ